MGDIKVGDKVTYTDPQYDSTFTDAGVMEVLSIRMGDTSGLPILRLRAVGGGTVWFGYASRFSLASLSADAVLDRIKAQYQAFPDHRPALGALLADVYGLTAVPETTFTFTASDF